MNSRMNEEAGGPAHDELTGPLREAFQALFALEHTTFEAVPSLKKNFELLQSTFRKMKGLNNELLPEYVRL